MDINNPLVEKVQKNDIENQNGIKLNLTILNNVTSILIFIMISYIVLNGIMNYALALCIITQCFILGYMFYVKYKRKNNTEKKQIKEEGKNIQSQRFLFFSLQNYLIRTDKFELIYLSVVQTLCISIFEVIIHDHSSKQEGIILSLFISLFINVQLKGQYESNLSILYASLFQVYTLTRIQLFYSFNYFDFILNILYSIYQISYLKNFVTQKKEHKISKNNHKSKTELTMRLYKSILSIIPDGLAVINKDKKLVYANPTLKKILQANQKNDILQILMNLGNNVQTQNQQNIPAKTKVKIDTREKKVQKNEEKNEEFNEIKKQGSNHIIKPEEVQNKDKVIKQDLQVESEAVQEVNESFQQKQVDIKQQNMQIDEIKQEKSSFIAQCSIDHQYVYGQTINEQIDEDEKVKTMKQSMTSLNQINNNKIEKREFYKALQSQLEENKFSNHCIYQNNSNNSFNQVRSSHSVMSSISRIKSQKIKDSRQEYSSKVIF